MNRDTALAMSAVIGLTLSMSAPAEAARVGFSGPRGERRRARQGRTHETLKSLGLTKQRKY